MISPEEAKEKGAALLLDKKYAGKVGGYSDMTTRVWYAALATGQDPNNLKDMDTIWAKVRETRDLAKKFWSSGAELMDLLSKGEIVVTDAWSGRVAALQDQGHPIGYLDPAGSCAWMEDMLILKGSPMTECEELINFMLDPATSIAVAEGQSYPPSLDPTKVKLTEKIEKLPAFDKTGTMKSLTFADPVYWATNEDAWTKQWNRISKGARRPGRRHSLPAGLGRGKHRHSRRGEQPRRSSSATSTSLMASSSPCAISRCRSPRAASSRCSGLRLRQDDDPALDRRTGRHLGRPDHDRRPARRRRCRSTSATSAWFSRATRCSRTRACSTMSPSA
ncbi:extracellular solute-binding protein [Mesorhizobium atlanticum]